MLRSSLVALLLPILLAVLGSQALGAESLAQLANGQKIQGEVLASSDIRLKFPLPADVEPRLTLTLLGSLPQQPISFRTQFFGPDGKEIALDSSLFTETHSNGRDTLSFRGWTSTQSGDHEFLIHTTARVTTQVRGKFSLIRTLKIPIVGDENSAPILVALEPNDQSSVVVKRVSGT